MIIVVDNGYDSINEILKYSPILRRKILYLMDISYLDKEDIMQELFMATWKEKGDLGNACIRCVNSLLKKFTTEHELRQHMTEEEFNNISDKKAEIVSKINDVSDYFNEDDWDSLNNYKNLKIAAKEKNINYSALSKRIYRVKQKIRKETQ